MIGIKRGLVMLAAGAALAVSGSVGAPAAPLMSSSVAAMAPAAGVTLAGDHGNGRWRGRYNYRHRSHNNFWWGAPLIAAPFLYGAYGGYDGYGYGYNGYGYRSGGGGNGCYRACRYDHGPRFCRYHWEDYC